MESEKREREETTKNNEKSEKTEKKMTGLKKESLKHKREFGTRCYKATKKRNEIQFDT